MPDERLPQRVLFGHMDASGVRGRSQEQGVDYVKEDLQFAGLVLTGGGIPRQGRLEGCHEMCAAKHPICGLEGE